MTSSARTAVTVEVAGELLKLTNLDKVLYPEAGFTKGEVIDYYRRVAPVMLPHLAERPVTLRRYPDGVAGESFFNKDAPHHAPSWVHTVPLDAPGSTKGPAAVNHHVVIADMATLIWAANLAALEFHVPQWTVGPRGARYAPDLLVFDLDPGAPATIVECCRVAERIHEALRDDDLTAYAKTSGSKGLQLYAPVTVTDPEQTSTYARALAQRLAADTPGEVVARMAKSERAGKVFVDWSQNNPAKTTVAPYSLRGRPQPTVSTPVTWDEVAACRSPAELTFTAHDVATRVAEHGDLLAGLSAGKRPRLPQ